MSGYCIPSNTRCCSFPHARGDVPQLEARIQRRFDSITPAQVVGLRKIIVSIKDGMSKPEDWFEPIAKDEAKPSEAAKPKKLRDALKPAASPESVAATDSACAPSEVDEEEPLPL